MSTIAAARSEAEKEVAAAFQVLSDLPGEGSTFRNLKPVASWTLTHLTFEPLPTRTLWHDFLPPRPLPTLPALRAARKNVGYMSDRIEHSCRTSLGRLVISMSVGRMVAGVQDPGSCLAVTKTPAAGMLGAGELVASIAGDR